ncbi:MAG: hypothetical protein NTY19_08650 [Planctomycetota bacterium]|nr:hypothetical protein [Planctomycetota bacterium]
MKEMPTPGNAGTRHVGTTISNPLLQPHSRTEWPGIVSALVGSLVILLVLSLPHLRGQTYTRDDLGAFHYPLRVFYSDCLANGHSFDWMPTIFAGFFVSGEGQLGAYHPYHWLLYRCFPVRTAFHLELLSSYPCMLAGMYVLLRPLVERRDAALFGAMVFTFSGFNTLHFIHPNAIAIVAHIPWLLSAIHGSVTGVGKRRLLAETGLALLTASQLLLGYPQYVWFSLLTEAAWAVFLLRTQWSLYVRLSLLKAIGVVIGAIQLLPTWESLQDSERGAAGLEFLMAGSWDPVNLLQLLMPYVLATRTLGGNTHEFGLYVGAAPLILGGWLLFRACGGGRQQILARSVALFLLVALILACGQFGGLAILQTYLPLVGSFRFPARALVLVHLAWAVLAALALTAMNHEIGKLRRPKLARLGWYLTAFSLAASMAVFVIVSYRIGSQYLASWPWMLAGPVLIAAGSSLCCLLARGKTWAVPALVLFTAADLGFYGGSYAIFPCLSAAYAEQPVLDLPPGQAGERVVADPKVFGATHGRRVGNVFAEHGFCQVDGYAGLEPRSRLFGPAASVPALRAAGVRWVAVSAAPPETEQLQAASPSWCEVPQPLPRIRLVTRTMVSPQPSRDIQAIDLETTVLVESPLPIVHGVPGDARLVTESPGSLVIRTEASSPQLLVVADRFHPGWLVRVDGVAMNVLRVNGDFLGCLVPAGTHAIQWEFRPASLCWGRRISLLGVGFLGVFLAVSRGRWNGNSTTVKTRLRKNSNYLAIVSSPTSYRRPNLDHLLRILAGSGVTANPGRHVTPAAAGSRPFRRGSWPA